MTGANATKPKFQFLAGNGINIVIFDNTKFRADSNTNI